MMTFALLAPYQILEVCLWQGKSESDIHGTYFFQFFFLKFLKKNIFHKKLSSRTLEILAPTVTYFKKNTFGAKKVFIYGQNQYMEKKSTRINISHK